MKRLLDLAHGFDVDLGGGSGGGAASVVAELAQARAGPFDGEALVVEQVADAQEQLDVLPPVEPLPRTRLLRLDGVELGLPVAQDVGLDARTAGPPRRS